MLEVLEIFAYLRSISTRYLVLEIFKHERKEFIQSQQLLHLRFK